MTDADPLLAVDDLRVTHGGRTTLDGVTLAVRRGECLGLVGESGAGKSTLVRAVVSLLDDGAVRDGDVRLDGESLREADERRLDDLRGSRVGVAFQDGAFDPAYRVGAQVADAVRAGGDGVESARDRALELMAAVGLPDPPATAGRYPHQLSAGTARRARLAAALAGDPDLLVVDEPTASLDVNESARLVGLLTDLRASRDLAVVHVAHDLSLVSYLADRVLVLYLGRVVEAGPTDAVLSPPYHPYTRALLSAVPEPDPEWTGDRIRLRGDPPSPTDPPDGCRFHTRCPVAREECAEWETDPSLTPVDDAAHRVACPYATEPWEPVAEENPGEEATDT